MKVIIRGEPDDVHQFRDHFADFLSNVTGLIINVDEILPHKDQSGQPDPRRYSTLSNTQHQFEIVNKRALVINLSSNLKEPICIIYIEHENGQTENQE